MTFEVSRIIAGDHPALAGHFPGNPIVPGVLILDEVIRAVEQWRGVLRLKKIVSVKFDAPLEPGVAFTIALQEAGPSHIVFECVRDGEKLAGGRLEVECGEGES